MSYPRIAALLCALSIAAHGPAAAQDDEARASFGGDAFHVGRTIVHDAEGTDDLFAAGQRIRIEAAVSGSVYAAGQSIGLDAAAGGDVHMAGQTVTVLGETGGDLSAAGQDIRVSGPVAGDLRAAGSVVELIGPVTGYALVGAEELRLDAAIAGDAALAVRRATFGDDARIDGTLTLYEETPGTLEVPEQVAPADRIERRSIDEWDPGEIRREFVPTWGEVVRRFLGGVIMVAILAALVAALVPERLADMRRTTLARPFATLGAGFVAQSAIVGSIVVVGFTLIGLILVPAILLLAGASALAGYVVGAYAFGVGLLLLVGRDEPDSLADRAIAAGAGALVAGVFALVPFLGWLFVMALSLTGIGAIVREIWGPWGASSPPAEGTGA